MKQKSNLQQHTPFIPPKRLEAKKW